MTDDLRPRSHVQTIVTVAIAVATTTWGAMSWLQSRADKPAVDKLANVLFQQQLDSEVFKGELKAINIRLDRIERATDVQKPADEPRRRR